jgi:uncharacterized protein YceH (UPF0502 family)
MLPRRPGHKENRFVHLFCPIEQSEAMYPPGGAYQGGAALASAGRDVKGVNDRVEILEEKVNELEIRLNALQDQFLAFRQQFE